MKLLRHFVTSSGLIWTESYRAAQMVLACMESVASVSLVTVTLLMREIINTCNPHNGVKVQFFLFRHR